MTLLSFLLFCRGSNWEKQKTKKVLSFSPFPFTCLSVFICTCMRDWLLWMLVEMPQRYWFEWKGFWSLKYVILYLIPNLYIYIYIYKILLREISLKYLIILWEIILPPNEWGVTMGKKKKKWLPVEICWLFVERSVDWQILFSFYFFFFSLFFTVLFSVCDKKLQLLLYIQSTWTWNWHSTNWIWVMS